MSYNINNFLIRVSDSDTLLHLREPSGNIKWTINAFDIVSSFVSSNLLRINTKTEYITLDFGNNTIAKMALSLLQNEIRTLRSITPYRIDGEIENYITSYVESKVLSGPTGSTGSTGLVGPTGTSVGTVYYVNYDGLSRLTSTNGSPVQTYVSQNGQQTITFTSSVGDPSLSYIKDGMWDFYFYFTVLYDNIFGFNTVVSKVDGSSNKIILSSGTNSISLSAVDTNLVSMCGYGVGFTTSNSSYIQIDLTIDYNGYQDVAEIEFINDTNRYSYISTPIPLISSIGQTGPQGDQGLIGPTGSTGVSDIYRGTSSTTIVVPDTGYPIQFVTQPNLSYSPGQSVIVYNSAPDLYVDDDYSDDSTSAYMIGEIDYYYSDTGTMSLVIDYSIGVGTTFSMWYINLSGQVGKGFNLIGNTYSVDNDIIMEGTMIFQQTEEIMNTATAGSIINYNYNMGSIWYQTNLSSDYTANFIGLPSDINKAITSTVFITQGSTPYIANGVMINGLTVSLNWSNNDLPIGTSNNIDIIGYTFINCGGTFSVLAQLSTYGTL